MGQVHVRCYAELGDRLEPEQRQRDWALSWEGAGSVGDLLAALGIPDAEVDLVLLNGQSAALDASVRDGDRIALFPVFESFDIGPVQRLRERPLRIPRFLLDVHAGKLAAHLRMLGFDAAGADATRDETLVEQSLAEGRILVTRDRLLAARRDLTRVLLLWSEVPEEQLAEVVRRFQLQALLQPFTRCLRCNEVLVPVAKEQVMDLVPPLVREKHTEFRRCTSCGRVYWPGSHHERMSALIERVRRVDF